MLTLPSVLSLDDVVVFPDDTDCNLFYLLSTTPRIRMDGGSPVFNGLFWTDRADGTTTRPDGTVNSVAGLAGGWINFDVNLGIDEETKEKAKNELKRAGIQDRRRREIIKEEKERLRLISKARGESSPPDPDVAPIGEITFGSPEFIDGTVNLLEEKEGGSMVAWSSAGGAASLIGDNNAAFALRLSAEGAAVWYKSLQDEAKALSVRYNLKFRLRLPSLEIRAWAGSTQKLNIERQAERVWRNVDQGCEDADVERIDVTKVMQSLMEEGLVNIEIKKGSTQISDEHVGQLRNMAIKLIEEKVQEIIKSRIRGMTEEERKTSMIRIMTEEVASFVELRFVQRDVVEWQIAPQATIMNFLKDIPEQRKKHVTKLVDLADPVVSTIALEVKANAPWEELPSVSSVKVVARYPAAQQTKSWLFTKDSNQDTWRFRRPKQDDGLVKYSAEVFFRGISKTLQLPETTTNGHINLEIGKVGVIGLTFKPHPTLLSLSGDNKVTHIQVDLSYKEEGTPGHFTSSLVFLPDKVEGEKFEKVLYENIDAPVEYRVKYYSSGGKVLEMPAKKFYLTENGAADIFTPNPYQDTLELDVELASSPGQNLKKIIVDFLYEDKENGFESTDKVILSAEDDWEPVQARLVQLDKQKQEFKYRYKLISEEGFFNSTWISGSGDQTLVLPILQVVIDVAQLKLGEKYHNALLELLYQEGGSAVEHQIFLNAADAARKINWFIPRRDTSQDSYAYSLTLFPPNGQQIEVKNLQGRGKFLVVQDVNP